MTDIIEQRRNFFGSDGTTEYFIGAPNAEDIRGADWQYSKTYTKCLIEGITTSAEMFDILRRRGVIGEDFDMRVKELTSSLNSMIMKLNEATSNEDKATCAVKVAQAREALFQWNQRLSGPMSNTCEQIADDARLEYLTSCVIEDKDGKKIWDGYDAFLHSKDQSLSMRSRYEVMLYLQGYDTDFLEKTPEASAMREIEADILNRAALEAAAELASMEEEEKVIEATPVEAVKTTTKKKSTKATKDND